MKTFTVYNPTTGDIIRWGIVAEDSDAPNQANAGEAVLVGVKGLPLTQRVDTTQTPPVLVDK